MKRFSQASENNKKPILEQLRGWLGPGNRVLEIGSGSGQHTVFFSRALPTVTWQPSDIPPYFDDLCDNLADRPSNVAAPFQLDISRFPFEKQYDVIYLANVLHIMTAEYLPHLFQGASEVLAEGGQLLIYGPFKYGGDFTTESNANFDVWLKQRDSRSGIRDIETLLGTGFKKRADID